MKIRFTVDGKNRIELNERATAELIKFCCNDTFHLIGNAEMSATPLVETLGGGIQMWRAVVEVEI